VTRPLTEDSPEKQQSNYGYRIRQLERRPAQLMEPVDFVHLYSWNYDTDNAVPTATIRPVCDFASGRGFFENALVVGDGWTWNYDTGTVGVLVAADYLMSGWVQFNENANNLEQRIIILTFGASDRYIQIHPFVTASGAIAQYKLPVTAPRSTTLGTTSVHLEVWHDHGSDITIRDAELAVYRMRPYALTNINDRP